MALRKRVGVVTGRQREHLDTHLFGQQQIDTAQRRLDTGGIGIVDERNILRKTVNDTYLLFRKRSTGGCYNVLHTGLVHGYHIEIALHHDTLVAACYGATSLIKTI